jgi:hypothetical protein
MQLDSVGRSVEIIFCGAERIFVERVRRNKYVETRKNTGLPNRNRTCDPQLRSPSKNTFP